MEKALIIGGGPAGASLAARLAGAGLQIRLIEREAKPHDKVCGEFLSFEAGGYLAELGLDLPALGAVPIGGVEVIMGHRTVQTRLPFAALSLSRRIMDEALLARAAKLGAQVDRGRRVTTLEREGPGWRARLDDGDIIEASEVFLATGKHDLRGWKRPRGPQADLIGFKQHWTLAPGRTDPKGRVELHLFPGGYAGLEPIEGDRANLCLVVRQRALKAVGGGWAALFETLLTQCPALAKTLEGGAPSAEKPLAIASIPYGHVRRRSDDGLWRLGDQAAVIPSLAGEGMSIALHSARLAAEAWISGASSQDYQRALARDVRRQVGRATWISRGLVRSWSQDLMIGALRLQPDLLSLAAGATRIPDRALGRA